MIRGNHPEAVLYSEGGALPELPAVEHFAGSERLMRKALDLQTARGPVFDITFDCEDGAPAGAERDHAEMIAALIMSADNTFDRVGARIHDITHTAWRTDLEQIVGLAGTRLAYLVLPKARSVRDVERVLTTLREMEERAGFTHPIPLHVTLETHGALRHAWEIAALPGIETVDFGLMDFVSSHHGALGAATMRSPGQFEHPVVVAAKVETVRAALAHGVLPSHNVCIELEDEKVIESDARRAREQFGFLRMWSIHPCQIEPILRGMQPERDDVLAAGEILLAAQDTAWGPIRHRDRLHDRASYRFYWNVLRRAHSTGITLPTEVLERFFTEAQ
jgi:citrate lyase subunit beta / citryl-CoA lyase